MQTIMRKSLEVFIICLLFPLSWGHLCLIHPLQRGAMEITMSGSKTCFRHEPECGGQPPETPVHWFMGGKQMWIKWQQNYNHYDVGYPGYMDVAYAPLNSSNWKTIAYVADEYFYAQDHQRNYTAIVVLPNIECAHCVIRARYQSHKPGESIFYQCSDVVIKQTHAELEQAKPTPLQQQDLDTQYGSILKKYNNLKRKHDSSQYIDQHCLIGFSYNRLTPFDSFLMSVNLRTGETREMEKFYINIALQQKQRNKRNRIRANNGDFVYDAISAINSNGNFVNLYHTGETADIVIDFVMEVDLKHPGDVIKRAKIVNNLDFPISTVMPYAEDSYYTVTLADRVDKGQFQFILGKLTYTAIQQFSYKPIMWSEPESLYVNYQWAEYDSVRNRVYLLMGNENSPDRLQARIYTYDITEGNVSWVEVDVSDYTYMSFHVHKKTGRLFAVSPGLTYHFNPYWSLIEVDPSTGKSKNLKLITNVGYFSLYYGGTVFNGIDEETDTLYHVLRLIDTNADVIVGININTYKMTFSEITNLRHLHNLSYIRANNTCYL
ncbi:Hypothetical predicted protein [Mytilus galloprovincialis]|uniref:Uncharacterized protein n=2 Tax=Mytilus galloprovincialis TaxID=29158 RepID=A0A8B6G833_MYTGA|nr:Hypothetical predicted protein [Mytilus galloprovincialis]